MSNELHDQELVSAEELFSQLSIHQIRANCEAHTTFFPMPLTKLWKDLSMMLEDSKPPDWSNTREALLAVPFQAQLEFIREGVKTLRKPAEAGTELRIKNYGIPYTTPAGEDALLAGQVYKNQSPESLEEWALGLYGIEFRGEYVESMVISIDLANVKPATVRRINRTELWPTQAHLRAFIDVQSDQRYPFNSRAVQALFTSIEKQSMSDVQCGTDDLLLALAEQRETVATLALTAAGFKIEAAKKQLLKSKNDQSKDAMHDTCWFHVFQQAQELAATYRSSDTNPEHVLLALLRNSSNRACKLLDALKVRRQQVETDLLNSVQETI